MSNPTPASVSTAGWSSVGYSGAVATFTDTPGGYIAAAIAACNLSQGACIVVPIAYGINAQPSSVTVTLGGVPMQVIGTFPAVPVGTGISTNTMLAMLCFDATTVFSGYSLVVTFDTGTISLGILAQAYFFQNVSAAVSANWAAGSATAVFTTGSSGSVGPIATQDGDLLFVSWADTTAGGNAPVSLVAPNSTAESSSSGYLATTYEYSVDLPAGTAESSATFGTTQGNVTGVIGILRNATGIAVPSVVGTAASIAEAAIVAAGFIVGAVTYAPSGIYAVGIVSAQTPAGGSYVTTVSPINLVISTGLPDQIVPDLIGLTQAEATSLLLSLSLNVGAVGSANSQLVPSGEILSQNPAPGTSVGAGSIVSFVLSLGEPVVGSMFDYEATLISQYANSPTLLQLAANLNQYIDQSQNFANFYNYIWNVETAQGFGLDIWGAIVGVSRLLYIPNTTQYIGAYQSSESQPAQDYTPFGSQLNNPPVGGALYTGQNATQAYLLLDPAYRQLILAKAFANICTTTAPAINQILQTLFGTGMAYVLNTGPMAISYNFTFTPTPVQLAILEQSGVIPTPPGVSVTINTDV